MNINVQNSLSTVWVEIANNFNTDTKSITTFLRRLDGAGLPFLLVDMPGLGKDLDRSLDLGTLVVTSRFKLKHGTRLPVFLYEHFSKVFHKSGEIREYPEGIRELRQLLLMFYKFECDFTPEEEEVAVEKFRNVDESVKTDHWHWSLPLVRKHFQMLFPEDPLDIRAHHASGQTSDLVTNSQKRAQRRYIPSLNAMYDFSYFFSSSDHYCTWSENNLIVTAEPSSRLAFVPKDSRGPRSICMEPHERMFIQKGLQAKLYSFTEKGDSPAKGFVNFTDQMVNRNLAKKASVDRKFSTIDLKDASDLVSWNLISQLLRDRPEWLLALSASRSNVVEYKDERIVLKKFAPMGSALCFPIEAFLFWSIVRTLTDKVWVYGDDLIVPTSLVGKIMDRLELYGLQINRDKSLFTGYFRESCGGEYYRGSDISIVRLKSFGLINFVAFCNNFAERYTTEVSDRMISHFEQSSGQIICRQPVAARTSERGLVYYTNHVSSFDVFFERRRNEELQRYERRVPTPVDQGYTDKHLSDEDLYFDWLTTNCRSDSPKEDSHADDVNREFGPMHHVHNLSSVANSLFGRAKKSNHWSKNTRNKFQWIPEMGFATIQVIV